MNLPRCLLPLWLALLLPVMVQAAPDFSAQAGSYYGLLSGEDCLHSGYVSARISRGGAVTVALEGGYRGRTALQGRLVEAFSRLQPPTAVFEKFGRDAGVRLTWQAQAAEEGTFLADVALRGLPEVIHLKLRRLDAKTPQLAGLKYNWVSRFPEGNLLATGTSTLSAKGTVAARLQFGPKFKAQVVGRMHQDGPTAFFGRISGLGRFQALYDPASGDGTLLLAPWDLSPALHGSFAAAPLPALNLLSADFGRFDLTYFVPGAAANTITVVKDPAGRWRVNARTQGKFQISPHTGRFSFAVQDGQETVSGSGVVFSGGASVVGFATRTHAEGYGDFLLEPLFIVATNQPAASAGGSSANYQAEFGSVQPPPAIGGVLRTGGSGNGAAAASLPATSP